MVSQRLQAKVNAVNKANQHATEFHRQFLEALRPFLGKQVVKQDGGLLAKVEKLLPERPNTPYLRVTREHYSGSLCWRVTVSEPDSGDPQGSHTVLYFDRCFTVGRLVHGILTELCETPLNLRTDYTAEEVNHKQKVVEQKEREYREAVANLTPFTEHDR